MKRYQECNLLVRIFRRLKYQPYYFLKGVKGYIEQVITSRYKDDEVMPPRFIFKLFYSQWQSKAEWYYTYEEFKEEMKSWD